MKGGWNATNKGDRSTQKLVLLPLYPPQSPHGEAWNRIPSSTVRSRRLITCAIANPDVVTETNLVHTVLDYVYWVYLLRQAAGFWLRSCNTYVPV